MRSRSGRLGGLSLARPLLVSLALAAATGGCVVFERPRDRTDAAAYRALHPTPPRLPPALAAPFEPLGEPPTEIAWEQLERDGDVLVRRGRFDAPAVDGPGRVATRFTWYAPVPARGPRPLVLVMPILGGDYPVARHLARFLANHGWHAAFVHRARAGGEAIAGDESPAGLTAGLRDTLTRTRRTLRWLAARPEIDGRRLGVVGVSLGAIAGSILLALEPGIRAAVLIMGGGDLAGLIARSREGPVRALRRKWLHETGIDDPLELARRMRRALPLDPLRYAPYVGPERVLQMVSTHDHRVASPLQWRLWEALGRPAVRAMPIGHYTAIVYVGYAKREIVRFLRTRFRLRAHDAPRSPAPPPRLTALQPPPYDTDPR